MPHFCTRSRRGAAAQLCERLESRVLLAVSALPEYRGVNAMHVFGGSSDSLDNWKPNIIREVVQMFDKVPMASGSIQVGSSWYHNLQGVANANRANGIITVFCPFGWDGANILGNTPSEVSYWPQFNDRLKAMAAQFANQSDVWLSVWNEPYAWDRPTDPDVWLSDMQTMVSSIRSTGNTNKIVIPGGAMAGHEDVILANGQKLIDFDPAHNIVFDLHAYNHWHDDGQAGMEARMQSLIDAGMPFIMGEYGAYTPGGTFDVGPFLRAAQNKRIPALAWVWNGADSNRLTLSDGSLNSSLQNYYWAQQVFNYTSSSATVLPTGWVGVDIGSPATSGLSSFLTSTNTYSVAGAGTDIWTTADQFRYAYQEVEGDQTIIARLNTQQNTDEWAKSGLMFRASTSASSPFAAILLTPGQGLRLQARTTFGAQAVDLANAPVTGPIWLRLARSGATVAASYSSEAGIPTNWTTLASVQISAMPAKHLAGLAVTSHASSTTSTASFTGVMVASTTGLPDGWVNRVLGNVSGAASCADDVFTVQSSGSGLAGAADQGAYASRALDDDQTLVARITSGAGAVMFRESAEANSPFAAAILDNNSVRMLARKTTGTQVVGPGAVSIPTDANWLRLARSGQTHTASYSVTMGLPGASDWITIGALDGVTIRSTAYFGGVFAAAGAATFSDVSVSRTTGLPAGWDSRSIGSAAGNATYSGSALTIRGGGADIWGASDQFQFISTGVAGDQTITARLSSLRETDGWAKAGVMFRAGTSAGSAYVSVLATPDNGIRLQLRATDNAAASDVASFATIFPSWLRLAKVGDQVTGYYSLSPDEPAADEWRALQTVTLNLPASYRVGLAVTSHAGTTLTAATFRDVSVIARPAFAGWRVNDGTAQRSMVSDLTATFTSAVLLDAGALSLVGSDGSAVPFTHANPSGDDRTWLLSFQSLPDDTYDLRVDATKVRNRLNQTGSPVATFSIKRLFGDATGDGKVDMADNRQFVAALGSLTGDASFRWYLDYNNDGKVDMADNRQLLTRLGR